MMIKQLWSKRRLIISWKCTDWGLSIAYFLEILAVLISNIMNENDISTITVWLSSHDPFSWFGTVYLDVEVLPDEGEECGGEVHLSLPVQRHVHPDQLLVRQSNSSSPHTRWKTFIWLEQLISSTLLKCNQFRIIPTPTEIHCRTLKCFLTAPLIPMTVGWQMVSLTNSMVDEPYSWQMPAHLQFTCLDIYFRSPAADPYSSAYRTSLYSEFFP